MSGKTCFVKVHATWDVLTKYAELTNLKMPLAVRYKFGKCIFFTYLYVAI